MLGVSKAGQGVWGKSVSSTGVVGETTTGWGVSGESQTQFGVVGISHESAGVKGVSERGRGTEGVSTESEGVVGFSTKSTGVLGQADGAGNGVEGTSKLGIGVFGKGGRLAGLFQGDVEVTGDIRLTGGNDVAEHFSVINTNSVSPGCVMTFNEDGSIEVCNKSYDKKVAGVISGAGDYKPGLLLGKEETEADKMPIALMGKVFCWVDADLGSVEAGDLLTTSSTNGHAMKAKDPFKAFGAVIGKALKPLIAGKGLIPILVALQ
ncbi:MAG: hypothetical protein WKG06_22320 [Segetibacter sp.]